jgi:MHS family shikimate/dehydroshikimate transporter-like MFS transporter
MKYNRSAFFSCFLGSFICWYDFFIFAIATAMIFSPQFFPGMSFLIPLMVFAVGFFARPVGSMVFGHLGDRYGRKKILLATLLATATATVVIGLLPSYNQIGVLAPVLLILMRVVQTFAFGAELAATSTIMYEYHAEQKNKGMLGSFLSAALPLATVAASLMFLFANSFGKQEFIEWAWRLPFLFSAVLFVVGFYVRYRLLETPKFTQAKSEKIIKQWPVVTVLKYHWKQLFLAVGISQIGAVWNYTLLIFGFAYLINTLGIPRVTLTETLTWLAAVGVPLMIFFGWLGDRFNRLTLYHISIVAGLIMIIPILNWLSVGNFFWPLLLGYLIIGKLGWAQAPTFYAELFPTEVRQTGVGMIYNLAAVIGGGIAPLIAQMLFDQEKNIMAVGWMLLGFSLLAWVSTLLLKRYYKPA